jgi:hypothetical protein
MPTPCISLENTVESGKTIKLRFSGLSLRPWNPQLDEVCVDNLGVLGKASFAVNGH